MKNIRNIIEQKYPPENPNDLWMKDNVLYKSTHKGWTPLTAGGGSSTNGVTSTTWLELKDKRDAGKLTPGALYRITDYNCTTTQENTQSAGHQFDIVLLALSENKLAEEGWAMMHDNIYDVTFADGVTKKCYLYETNNEHLGNIVDVTTLLGVGEADFNMDIDIDEDNKTAICTGYESDELSEENLPYNYFQNSNLSAWKVWYCLDNDTARFAWADDSVDNTTFESIVVENTTYTRSPNDDDLSLSESLARYAWRNGSTVGYTINEHPDLNEILFDGPGSKMHIGTITSYTPAHEGTGLPNGRGVIYRLIDEWGNDVPWDYKNILFTINDETTYSLSMAGQDSSDEFDATLNGGTLGVIVNTTHGESRDGRTPKSIYPISRVMLQQCPIYLNEDVSPDSYLFTNNSHANIIYGLEIYDPNA